MLYVHTIENERLNDNYDTPLQWHTAAMTYYYNDTLLQWTLLQCYRDNVAGQWYRDNATGRCYQIFVALILYTRFQQEIIRELIGYNTCEVFLWGVVVASALKTCVIITSFFTGERRSIVRRWGNCALVRIRPTLRDVKY